MQYSMLIGPFQKKYLNGPISIAYFGVFYCTYNTTVIENDHNFPGFYDL